MQVRTQELRGQALAWAVCDLYGMAACIMGGVVCVIQPDGQVLPFDADAMLRSLVLGHRPAVEVPDELLPEPERGPRTDCGACGGGGCDRCIPDEFGDGEDD